MVLPSSDGVMVAIVAPGIDCRDLHGREYPILYRDTRSLKKGCLDGWHHPACAGSDFTCVPCAAPDSWPHHEVGYPISALSPILDRSGRLGLA